MNNNELYKFLKEHCDWSDEDIESKNDLLSYIPKSDEQSYLDKADFYKKTFNLTQTEFNKMLKSTPELLGYSDESVIDKADSYKEDFNLTQAEFNKMLKTLPALLGLSADSVIDKTDFYKRTFNLTQIEFNKMLKISYAMLCYSAENVLKKKENFDKLKIDKDTIVNSPSILLSSPKNFIVKYMLHFINSQGKQFLNKGNWFLTSADKLWARFCFLKDKEGHRVDDIVLEEKAFQKKYSIESTELMKQYPLTKKAVEYVNYKYNELALMIGEPTLTAPIEEENLDK